MSRYPPENLSSPKSSIWTSASHVRRTRFASCMLERCFFLGDSAWLQSNHEQALRQDYNLFFRRSSPNQVGEVPLPRRDKNASCQAKVESIVCGVIFLLMSSDPWTESASKIKACTLERCSGKPCRFNACTFYTNVNHDTEEMHELTEALICIRGLV